MSKFIQLEVTLITYHVQFTIHNSQCYLWVHKKLKQPYVDIVDGKHIDHPDLLAEKRSRMKIILIDPKKDIPVGKLNGIFKKMLALLGSEL